MGAFGFTSKPVERDVVLHTLEEVKSFVAKEERRIALVGPDGESAEALRQCFGALELIKDICALAALPPDQRPDVAVVEYGAAGIVDILETLKTNESLTPVVLYAPDGVGSDDDRRLRLAVFGGLVRLARTPEQLIDQTALMLHAPVGQLPDPAQAKLAQTRREDPVLNGRTVVVIDDDIRNIFSLASALEEYGINLCYAESGRAGLDLLKVTPEVDVMLVDIMMPDMDGYETIREVRALPEFAELPIVAVTAKAMKGDRQKCIQAGASDYVSKPVDIDQLISVLRVSIRRADAQRLTADNIVALLPQAS
jgi:CheY-like chemotaxis protein